MKIATLRLALAALFAIGLHISNAHAEDVDVVEAVSSDTDHLLLGNGDRDDLNSLSAGGKTDQLALESLGDQESAAAAPIISSSKHVPYNGPPPPLPSQHRGPPPALQHGKNFGNGNKHMPFGGGGLIPPKQQQQQQLVQQQAMDKYGSAGGEIWPAPVPEMPKIISLDVKCEKNLMKVYLGFDKPFYGIIFSKGHYSNAHCVHLPAGLGRTSAHFEIGIHACGTSGNTENGLYGYGAESGSGTFFENIIVIQYDPQVQEVWDQARKLRCTWHDQYEKSVTFRPFPVDMLDVVRTDFAGDNVGCWMQIQVGKGPWASEVSGLVKIGQTMTMVLAIKDDDAKFDMLVRNCMAHDGKRAPIQLVDQKGCVTRPKLMSRFTKIKNFGASASVLSYAHFQAFKFPDSMEVHFQCTIQICRYQCPDQCSEHGGVSGNILHNGILDVGHSIPESSYGVPQGLPLDAGYLHRSDNLGGGSSRPRDERRARRAVVTDPEKEVGVNRIIRVVSTGDLTFSIDESANATTTPTPTIVSQAQREDYGAGSGNLICMTTPGFAVTLILLLAVLVVSCLISAFLYVRLRPLGSDDKQQQVCGGGVALQHTGKSKALSVKGCFYS